ncbi:MAG: hypothetical protein IJ131_11445, partial [Eggerthellaceae bacterium]|nr:hypothetical protein [Eggerthellaceae bacterium]
MQCPTCGAEVTPEQLTCRECGSDLVALQVVGKLTEGTSAPSRDASIDSLAESSAHADRSGHAADSSRYAEVGVSSFEMEDAESVSIAASSHSREERVAKERAARKAAREQHSAEKEARSAE